MATTLIDTILEEAKADAAAVVSAAKENVAIIEKETEVAIAAKRAEHEAALKKQVAHIELVATSQAEQAAKIAQQTAKRVKLDEIFADAFSTLADAAVDQYVAFFKKHAAATLPQDASVTKVEIPAGKVDESAALLKELRIDAPTSPVTTIKAGAIFFTTNGVYDVTLDRLFTEARAELEMELMKAF